MKHSYVEGRRVAHWAFDGSIFLGWFHRMFYWPEFHVDFKPKMVAIHSNPIFWLSSFFICQWNFAFISILEREPKKLK